MPTSAVIPISAPRARRDRVFAVYAPLLAVTARRLKATLPATIDARDLSQTGAVALAAVLDHLESYLITRLRGAMLDSVNRRHYPDARIVSIDSGSLCELPQFAVQPVAVVEQIDAARRRESVVAGIRKLPVAERRVIAARLRGEPVLAFAARARVSERTVIRRGVAAVAQLKAAAA